MKVYHILGSIDEFTGGPSRSVTQLIEALIKAFAAIEIVLYTRKTKNPIIEKFQRNNGFIKFQDYFKFNLLKILNNPYRHEIANIYHGHGLWDILVHKMAKIARKRNIPYIITPRGMLEPWALQQSKIKKKIAMALFQKKDLENATCLHATAPLEVRTFRNLGFKNPIAMIPNGIDLSDFPNHIPEKQNNPKKILFLSRIHPKKGIENLIDAWSLLNKDIRKNWIIQIVGNGEKDYIASIKEIINNRQMHSQICIKPPVFGLDKIKLFREASLFVLPTYSENFGIVVAEALASFTPVITTKGAPWEDLETHHCGWWIDIGVQPLKKALEKAILTPKNELKIMGNNGRQIIEEKYSIESSAKLMLELYDWILNKGEKPDFIFE